MYRTKTQPLSVLRGVFFIFTMVAIFTAQAHIDVAAQDESGLPTVELELLLDAPRRPVSLLDAGDGRFFYAQQTGRIFMIEDWELTFQQLVDVSERTPLTGIERGLLGMALDPDFAENGYFYLVYTLEDEEGATIVSRFQEGENFLETLATEEILLNIPQPYADHNGGQLTFGPDGYLYIGIGDGGGPVESGVNAQDTQNLLGTILRIDVSAETAYSIPPDNPFVGNESRGLPEIFLYGFRNPWRFSFDRLTGDLYIGDVGSTDYEEINVFPADSEAGLNYGWNFYEGPEQRGDVVLANHTEAAYAYAHNVGCAIIGGFVYRGEEIPDLQGYYIYTDYCNRNIWWLRQNDGVWETDVLIEFDLQIVTFTEDSAGELFGVAEDGQIFKLVAAIE